MSAVDPLWRRALIERERERLADSNRGAASRLALKQRLFEAGRDVPLATIHRWTRAMQGEAYLWAVAFAFGREDLPAPDFVDGVPGPLR